MKECAYQLNREPTILDGNADPTGILAEIEACLQVTLGDLLQLDLHAQVDANVDDVVDAVAKTYTVRILLDTLHIAGINSDSTLCCS